MISIIEECQVDRWICSIKWTIEEESRLTGGETAEEEGDLTEEGEQPWEDLGPAWDHERKGAGPEGS